MQLWLLITLAVLAISQMFGGSSTGASASCTVCNDESDVEKVKIPTNGKGGEVLNLEKFQEFVVGENWVAVYDLVSTTPANNLTHMYRWAGNYSGPDNAGKYTLNYQASSDRNDSTCEQVQAEYTPLGNDGLAVFKVNANNTAGQYFELLLSNCPVKYMWRFICTDYSSYEDDKDCPVDDTYLQLIVKKSALSTGMDDLPWASIEKDLDDNAGSDVKGFCRHPNMESHFLLLGDCD